MKEYIRTLIYVSVFSIILEIILPETKLKKYISTMISLLVVLVTISPIIKFIKNEDILAVISETYNSIDINIEDGKSYGNNEMYSNEQIRLNTKRKLELDMLNKCNEKGYLVNRVEVNLTNEYLISEVNIYISNIDTVNDAKKIINYIEDIYDLKKQVINIVKGE